MQWAEECISNMLGPLGKCYSETFDAEPVSNNLYGLNYSSFITEIKRIRLEITVSIQITPTVLHIFSESCLLLR